MASDDNTDMLMMMVCSGVPMQAEGQSEYSQAELDADTLLSGFKLGQFFEVSDVDLGFSTSDSTTKGGAANKAIDGDPVSVTRTIDAASPTIMQYCVDAVTLDSAAIVKRRAAGVGATGLGYLRLDFTGVLITRVAWSDSHVVKETITMIYREVKITYRQQESSGRLGAKHHAEWKLFT
jgi:type VI protein secretion system component Hcp